MSRGNYVSFRRRRRRRKTFVFFLLLSVLWPKPYQPNATMDLPLPTYAQAQKRTNISPFDDLIKKYSQRHGFDWRLIAALIATESSFNRNAISKVGAQGLMQLMPSVQQDQGIDNAFHPEENIKAGVAYFRELLGRVQGRSVEDQISFALAAYNGGIGHLIDAQSIARKWGKDPYRWSVIKKIFIEMEDQPKVRSMGRYGYVQGRSVVAYVDKIMYRYQDFRQDLPEVPQIKL